jgi:hypothetical protein
MAEMRVSFSDAVVFSAVEVSAVLMVEVRGWVFVFVFAV